MSTTTTTTKPEIGALVLVSPAIDADMKYEGVIFKVVGHLTKNITIESTNHLGSRATRLRIAPEHVVAAPEGTTATTPVAQVVQPAYLPPLPLGTVFTVLPGTLRGVDEGTFLVVIGHSGLGHKATRLGGDADRYWPKVARAAMREVDIKALLKQI